MKVPPTGAGRASGLEAESEYEIEEIELIAPPPAPVSGGRSPSVEPVKAKSTSVARETRVRQLADPQALQQRERLEREIEAKKIKPGPDNDLTGRIKSMIDELRSEARAFRGEATDLMTRPDPQDQADSVKFMGVAISSDSEASSLEQRLRDEERRKKTAS